MQSALQTDFVCSPDLWCLSQRLESMRVISIHGLDEHPNLELPLLESLVPAGFPSPASDYVESRLDLNKLMVKHPHATVYMRVAGDSMINAGILDRDYLVVDRAVEATNNKIVIAALDDELCVKRLYKKGRTIELRSENDAYEPVRIHHESQLIICGVVAGVCRTI